LSNSLLNSVKELLEIISSLLLFLSTIFAKYFIFWFFTWLTVTEDWLEEDWLESWFLKIDIISLLTTFEVLGIDDDVSAEEELDEEELGGSKEFRAEELDEEELGGSKEFREELDTEELGPEESVKGLEVGGEELDEEELGGSKEFRREELDGEEPIPCINESIVLSIIFPLPTLFKRLFISVSMFVGLETLSDCE
jgi:hypothetical protein